MFYSPILFSSICDVHLSQFSNCEYNMEELNKKEKIIIYALQVTNYLDKLTKFLDNIQKYIYIYEV